MGEIKAILVGVSDYSQFSNANMRNLPLCINDIMFMEFALVKGLSVKPENIVKLGENGIVTGGEFVRTIQLIISSVNQEDTLLFYFSGHGGTFEKIGHCFALSNQLVSTQAIIDCINLCQAKNKWIILDSCMSGNFMLSPIEELNQDMWIDGFYEKGCTVFSSCKAEQFSGFSPDKPSSLFTTFLFEALMSRFLIKDGKKSLNDIADYLRLRAQSWNEQHPTHPQTPIIRSNVGGTIMFEVEEFKPYLSTKYIANHDDYIIYDVEPTHNSIAKRYSVKVILKYPVTKIELSHINHGIVKELSDVEVFNSAMSESRWKGNKPNIVFCYYGYDDTDIINNNYAFRTIWVDSTQDRNWWYKKTNESEIINDTQIVTISYYDMMRRFNINHTATSDELIHRTKEIISSMINLAEKFIRNFAEVENEEATEEQFIQIIKPVLQEIEKLYFEESDLDIPPNDLHEWSQRCTCIAATIHDFCIYYSDKYITSRTSVNRKQCVKMTIKRYYQDLELLKETEAICFSRH